MNTRRFIAFLPALWLLLAPPGGSAQVYRCEDGDTTVFSDVPCADDARIHRSSERISVVAAPSGLEEVAARNRAFVEARRERLAEMRRRAAEARREDATDRRSVTSPPERRRAVVSPFLGPVPVTRFRDDADPRAERQRDRSDEGGRTREERAARRRELRSRSDDTAPIVRDYQ